MKRKHQRLAEKPVHLLTLAPDKGEKGAVNPFAPSPVRAAIGKVFVKLEDMTERFEDWCPANKMRLNEGKCKVLLINENPPH